MTYRPYPNPGRARAQLIRHDDETGPLRAARPMSPLERQLQGAVSAATQKLRPHLEAVATSVLAAFQPRPAGSEEKTG
jgi:hypothetical protein